MLLDLFTPNYKNAGSIKITVQFVKREVDPIPERINARCQLQLTINKATFLKDADIFGNQDPYIEWKLNGETMQTTVKDDAGKSATWDETFVLENVYEAVLNGDELTFTAWDEDNVQNDLLCEARPKLFQDLVTNEMTQNHCVDLYDMKKKTEKYGTLWYTTRYRFIPPSPVRRKMIDGANVSLWKGLSCTLGSID